MINHTQILEALRTKLLTLAVCTTGSVQLSATQAGGLSGYHRAAGSFYTDGFAKGQEVLASGFGNGANNGLSTIVGLTATDMTVNKTTPTVVEAAGARTLAVGLPSAQMWENKSLAPGTGVPYWEEGYLRGMAQLITVGPSGRIWVRPTYLVRMYAGSNLGMAALSKYADAILTLFAPKTAMALPNGDVLRVNWKPAPYADEIFPDPPGWAVLPITIPLFIETTNSI